MNKFDIDAQAFINAASITNYTQKIAINTLVISLKSYGIWTKMKAIYPIVGGNASTHKFNLKDPRDLDAAFRLTFNGGWTHSSNGALPNGSNGYANTNLIPSTSLTTMNTHISYYSRSNITTAGMVDNGCQADPGAKQMYVMYYNTSTQTAYSNQNSDANRIIVTETDSLGMLLASRTSSASLKAYKNGVLKGTNTSISTTALPDITFYIGGFNYKSALGSSVSYGKREMAFSTIGDGLTDTEAANYYTAVQAFQTTLGRQV
jgi:hypothetical protein